jgi:hypothetical protein
MKRVMARYPLLEGLKVIAAEKAAVELAPAVHTVGVIDPCLEQIGRAIIHGDDFRPALAMRDGAEDIVVDARQYSQVPIVVTKPTPRLSIKVQIAENVETPHWRKTIGGAARLSGKASVIVSVFFGVMLSEIEKIIFADALLFEDIGGDRGLEGRSE